MCNGREENRQDKTDTRDVHPFELTVVHAVDVPGLSCNPAMPASCGNTRGPSRAPRSTEGDQPSTQEAPGSRSRGDRGSRDHLPAHDTVAGTWAHGRLLCPTQTDPL